MEDNAWVVQSISGVCFVLAGVPLLRLASRSGQAPERMLGLTFLLMGVSYGFYQGPLVFASLEPLWTPLVFVGRLLYDASVVTVACFTFRVFRSAERWALFLAWSCAALVVAGLAVSIAWGDWEGLAPISNPGYWLEFSGQSIPFVWIAVEGAVQHGKARRRLRFGLSDPIVCNRFALWSLFGVMQWATILVLVAMNAEYEVRQRFSAGMDALEGTFEMLTILMIWLAFFPPARYRRWVAGAAAPAGSAGR